MKIQKGKVYNFKLSGDQMLLIRLLIVNSEVYNSLNEQGKQMADVLYDSLETDGELL